MIYTDLSIDVVVRKDYSVYTKDLVVFGIDAALRFPIVERPRKKVFESLDKPTLADSSPVATNKL